VRNQNPGPNNSLDWDDARLADETAAAMRDLARTVTEAPPLRLAAAPDELGSTGIRLPRRRRHGRHLRTWIIPAAAAVTVAAVAVALVLVRNIPNGRVPSPAPSATSATPVNPSGIARVPEYYVAWMQADRPYLVVGISLTGKQYATVPSPPGVRLDAVYGGSADNRTWIVHGTSLSGPAGGTEWYVLTIAPGTKNGLEMGSAGIPVRESPAGAVLSPDGTEVAVAVNGARPSLRVYSLRTGALLHSWSASSGKFAAVSVPPDSWQYTQLTLRWTPDGKQIAFAWNGKAIRVLDVAAPDGGLLGTSRLLATIGITYTTGANFTCKAWQGWEPITIAKGYAAGQGVICGGSTLDTLPRSTTGTASPAASSSQGCTIRNTPSVSFMEATTSSSGGFTGTTAGEPECPGKAKLGDGAYIGWSNADGSVLIGSLVWDGHVRFGIYRGQRFTPLPALPLSFPPPVGVLSGTDAW
jgi:hypothetical protein